MDPETLVTLMKSLQDIAVSNQKVVAEMTKQQQPPTTGDRTTTTTTGGNDTMGAVALTGIKVPLAMGDSAEERLINSTNGKTK